MQSVIKLHIDLTFQDELARNNTSDLLHHLNAILSLASAFKIDEEALKRFIACELYAVGLDIAAQEVGFKFCWYSSFLQQMIYFLINLGYNILREEISAELNI